MSVAFFKFRKLFETITKSSVLRCGCSSDKLCDLCGALPISRRFIVVLALSC